MLKLPHGTNTVTNNSNGTMPNQEFENFFDQNQCSQPFFQKNPKSSKPREFSTKSKKMKRLLKTYLGDDFAVIELEIWLVFE